MLEDKVPMYAIRGVVLDRRHILYDVYHRGKSKRQSINHEAEIRLGNIPA